MGHLGLHHLDCTSGHHAMGLSLEPQDICVVNSAEGGAFRQLAYDAACTDIVGFDSEWLPDWSSDSDHPVAVLQLAFPLPRRVYVLQLGYLRDLPREVRHMLANPEVLKVGYGIAFRDLPKLRKSNIFLAEEATLDLQGVCEAMLGWPQMARQPGSLGLNCAADMILGHCMNKNKMISCSDWDRPKLTPAQIKYAAMDAWITLCLYDAAISCASHVGGGCLLREHRTAHENYGMLVHHLSQWHHVNSLGNTHSAAPVGETIRKRSSEVSTSTVEEPTAANSDISTTDETTPSESEDHVQPTSYANRGGDNAKPDRTHEPARPESGRNVAACRADGVLHASRAAQNMEATLTCYTCGSPLAPNSKFCFECGTSLGEDAQGNPQLGTSTIQNRRKRPFSTNTTPGDFKSRASFLASVAYLNVSTNSRYVLLVMFFSFGTLLLFPPVLPAVVLLPLHLLLLHVLRPCMMNSVNLPGVLSAYVVGCSIRLGAALCAIVVRFLTGQEN